MTSEKIKEYILKFAILGDAGVGKTSLVNQYVLKSFQADYRATLGVNIVKKDINLEEANIFVRLLLWDIAGQKSYEQSRHKYYEGCSGALLVFDITRIHTFNNIKNKWYDDFSQYVKGDIPYILIGNKNDLINARMVKEEDALELSKELSAIELIETSAKNGINVERAFISLVREVLSMRGVKFSK